MPPGIVSEEIMQAINAFINADDWTTPQKVVEAYQALLFRSEVEQFFEQSIALAAQKDGKDRWTDLLKQRLELLRVCKAQGIAAAFAPLPTNPPEALPFDPELPAKSIAALLGSPQEKLTHTQYLQAQANQTTDEQLQALFQTIQLALEGRDLPQLGRDLQGIYRQTWDAIATIVEAHGVDLHFFAQLENNTLAALSPAASQRSKWHNTLADILNQATANGDDHLASLLNALLGLLDADGNPTGLGENLQGIYARTWQRITEQLPERPE